MADEKYPKKKRCTRTNFQNLTPPPIGDDVERGGFRKLPLDFQSKINERCALIALYVSGTRKTQFPFKIMTGTKLNGSLAKPNLKKAKCLILALSDIANLRPPNSLSSTKYHYYFLYTTATIETNNIFSNRAVQISVQTSVYVQFLVLKACFFPRND